MVANVNSLSKRLKQTRKAQKLTQGELAQRAGVSQQMVSDIERGRTRSVRDLVKLARALNVSADFLLGADSDTFADDLYDLIMQLSPDRREDALAILRTLAERKPRQP
jgi:transcriptional regulator with XRE-family HTH domain